MTISKYKWAILAGVIILTAVIFYLAKSVSAVNHTVRAFDEAYFNSLVQKENDTIDQCSIPGYIDLLRRKAFLSSQVRMADSDSIGLLINMNDSLIQLFIKGVAIRTVRMNEFEVSPFFQRANQEAIYSMLASPLVITGMNATFPKDPVNIKIAPKDSSFAVVAAKPDTTDFEAVFFTLETNRNIRFFFEQQEDTIPADRKALFLFDLKDRFKNAKATIRAVASFDTPPYMPYIKIRIPKAEAKILYRAIPREGMIVLTE
ncbi:MAG TPA: hypothetical protein VMV74_10255 [Bacteroidales bacterium]|nr:hypothetical protein [Bacteroidales bacterium]